MADISEILSNLGYRLTDTGREFRTTPLYRESDNPSVLAINKESGRWVDYGTNISGDLSKLVQLTLNLASVNEAETILNNKYQFNFNQPTQIQKTRIKVAKIFPPEDLKPIHDYWIKRGIGAEIIESFGGGFCERGKLEGRYVFPIFTSKKEIIGFAGRDVSNKRLSKWKLIGTKDEWKYPLFLNYNDILSAKSVFLVESIGDCLSLFQAGIKNVIVLFGVFLNSNILSLLIKLDCNKIYISTNNDDGGSGAGNSAAVEIQRKLLKHFDREQVIIKIPKAKDFNKMLLDEGAGAIKEFCEV